VTDDLSRTPTSFEYDDAGRLERTVLRRTDSVDLVVEPSAERWAAIALWIGGWSGLAYVATRTEPFLTGTLGSKIADWAIQGLFFAVLGLLGPIGT
jgi:hypothetical protein